LGLDQGHDSPEVLTKIVSARAPQPSFIQARAALAALAGLK
jgi:hypothetical protein